MTYAFFNFNTYLGGGETLIVRLADYLRREKYDFKIFFKRGSYIERDLYRIGVEQQSLCSIKSSDAYYYLDYREREALRAEINGYLKDCGEVCLVSLNSRELYTLTDLAKNNSRFRLAHLVLHDQDNLYACQSLLDKLILKLLGKRRFSRKEQVKFNTDLYNVICDQSVVIPQSELQACLLRNEFKIHTDKEKVVPLPVCDFGGCAFKEKKNNKKIVWIGRIVDFKLPALYVVLNFVSRRKDYALTIIGDGEIGLVTAYLKKNKISEDNITFLGKVDYAKLGGVVREHSIGYAMGTSIVEIGKYGLPVIMALGSPDFKKFSSDICGGLYTHQSRGNVGDTLYYNKHNDPVVIIDDAINEIETNYETAARACYDTLKANFDEKSDFALYMKWLAMAKSIKTDAEIPRASWLRKKLFTRLTSKA